VRLEVKALYQQLQKGKPKAGGDYLTYVLEPTESVGGKQRVRLAREVLFWGHGVCLDWVLLYAACVACAHIHLLIIVAERHAILGYWVNEKCAEKNSKVVLEKSDIEPYLKAQCIKVINATRIPLDESGNPMEFDKAEQEAETHLSNVSFAVDIRAAREAGIEPLRPLKPCPTNHELPPADCFQDRPELQQLHQFWRDEDRRGVLALVGIGGAGKTALAHRFLAQLPGSDVEVGGVEKDESLPIPDARFVWSFYTHPDSDTCATMLYNYLTGQQTQKATFEQVQQVLADDWRGCRVLLVFDGVEKLQIAPGIEPEKEGGTFGQFLSEGAPLARFLGWVCDGPRPVHVIVTSRFGLTDLRRYEADGSYRVVDVDKLPDEGARGLLWARGVQGLDWELDELVREFGNHAQMLDLLGNALRLFCGGDPARARELPSLEDVRHLADAREQAWGRLRVLRFYEQKLPPEELALLQRLCLFHIIPVTEELLSDIFLGEGREHIAGALVGKTCQNLHSYLLSLCHEYRLVRGEPSHNPELFTIHPGVCDYFYRRLEQPASLHTAISNVLEKKTGLLIYITPALTGHPKHLAEYRQIQRLAFGSPGSVHYPDEFDLVEELIYHTLRAGDVAKAFTLFFYVMGSYENLSRHGEYIRGERILSDLQPNPEQPFSGFHQQQNALLSNARGLFLRYLGHTRSAETCIKRYLTFSRQARFYADAFTALSNLSDVYILRGRLRSAISALDEATSIWDATGMGEGLRIASACGYALYHIDLLIAKGRLVLRQGDL
jgi:hypothetical protein